MVASRAVGSRSQALRAEFAIKQLEREQKIEAVESLILEDANDAAI
jgi:predicted GIY-YIG superfamily endonuclease